MTIDQIPLSEAVLCANCDFVTARQPDGRCSHCGSEALLAVSGMLELLNPPEPPQGDAVEVWTRMFESNRPVAERLLR